MFSLCPGLKLSFRGGCAPSRRRTSATPIGVAGNLDLFSVKHSGIPSSHYAALPLRAPRNDESGSAPRNDGGKSPLRYSSLHPRGFGVNGPFGALPISDTTTSATIANQKVSQKPSI
ncbi:hypothetical protein SAMN03159423_5303 [Bradyrhizobium sp. NFR13]|nr:hypothetical protein SAMN03159423_5303 [Bradyrhizobium sp. NFR13]